MRADLLFAMALAAYAARALQPPRRDDEPDLPVEHHAPPVIVPWAGATSPMGMTDVK